jgi:DNA-binding CsgD family transcriptional regulator
VLLVEERRYLSPRALRLLGLTRSEAEVLGRAARGGSFEQIGADLWISPGTVHKHLEHVYAKLGVDSRAAPVTRALCA